jgi:hypothetical protein
MKVNAGQEVGQDQLDADWQMQAASRAHGMRKRLIPARR